MIDNYEREEIENQAITNATQQISKHAKALQNIKIDNPIIKESVEQILSYFKIIENVEEVRKYAKRINKQIKNGEEIDLIF